MQIKIKSILLTVSLLINGIFILLIAAASFSKVSHFSFYAPDEGFFSTAAVVTVPSGGSAVIELVEIGLKPGEKAFLQFSVYSKKQQGNILINAVYDRSVISVSPTGYGIEITALAEGSTLMQTLTSGGVKDVALVIVEE